MAYMSYAELCHSIRESGKPYDMEMIEKAYQMASAAHMGQYRRSGEPYICHPLCVAQLLIGLGMDSESVAGALLHDVVEDTDIGLDRITKEFGPVVALLVDGVTKLTKIEFSSLEERQEENLRKMLLAMSQDVRVMIIKLCDRLHNMRTGDAWPEQKRRDKAKETMEVYAPIAHRLGISSIKEELEDRSLQYLDPVGYRDIRRQLEEHDASFLEKISVVVRRHLEENGIHDMTIKSRIKSVYGIYRKMYMQGREFGEIYDIYAVRIILGSVVECYSALGLIHDMYHPIPNRFKDYISTPKPNGYRSLHTTVIGQDAIPFEVQIRTREMDQTAEYGVAAHWKYKAGVTTHDRLEERLAWVRQLLESQQVNGGGEILQGIKSDLLPEEVFAFTPRGKVINLPAGATVIDFAYAIHSAVGNRMVGAKVNGHIVPIDHKVSTGEIIEVLTGPDDKGPSRDWLKIVRTSEAKNKIRTWFKRERREENIVEGRAALEKELRRNALHIEPEQWDGIIEEVARRQHMNSVDDLYAAIGYGGVLISKIMPKLKEEAQKHKNVEIKLAPASVNTVQSSDGVVVEGVERCPIKFAKCCKPLPGDLIVAFITRGFGVSIHKADCPNVLAARSDPENAGRFMPCHWAENSREPYKANLEISAMNRSGLLEDVAVALGDMRVPIYAVNAREVGDGRAVMSLTLGATNIEHLNNVVARLQKIRDVISVSRS